MAEPIFHRHKVTEFLPTSVKEMKALGWTHVDVVLFSGDAYVDHPSFGAAVIGRTLQAAGYNVAIVPQPNWQDDLRDFKKFGTPRLFFGISAGAMDSMVNHYTAARRRRSDDAYTAGGRHGARPDYPTVVYGEIIRRLFPDTPLVVGGIEASLRRLSHYDYWQDRLRPSIMMDTPADILIYGMGEKPIVEIARRLDSGENVKDLTDIMQTAIVLPADEMAYAMMKCLIRTHMATYFCTHLRSVWPTNAVRLRISSTSSSRATDLRATLFGSSMGSAWSRSIPCFHLWVRPRLTAPLTFRKMRM